MMLLLLVLSSSEVARAEAQVWLAAFDEARATGATELQAHRYACGELGVFDRGSGMVAAPMPPARHPRLLPSRIVRFLLRVPGALGLVLAVALLLGGTLLAQAQTTLPAGPA